MASTLPPVLVSGKSISTVLELLSPARVVQYLDLYHVLNRWWQRHRQPGMYEILDYDSTLELVDTKGKTAIFTKQQRVKFIQDHIIAFQDYAWAMARFLPIIAVRRAWW